jgi:hypothetical protein
MSTTESYSTFLSPRLHSLFSNNQATVTTTLAKDPTVAVSQAAENLYGQHHGHVHHDLAKDDQAEGERTNGTLGRLLSKLHLSKVAGAKEHTAGDETNHKNDHVHNPAADQWKAMRVLNAEELAEVAKCGNWGSAKPDELFLNVSLIVGVLRISKLTLM